ncbi:MAG: hypothetical protein IJM72_04510 [Deltaproteobacteria bacterium]|nr:hypothetical protein [Deltaproteobacteria bacterium]
MLGKLRVLLLTGAFVLITGAFCGVLCAGGVAQLDFAEAEKILEDTCLIWAYEGLKDENDYRDKPQNVVRAALFGARDVYASFRYHQEERKEQGQAALPRSTPLFKIGERTLAADQVVEYDENPDAFAGLPRPEGEMLEHYTHRITRQAVELAALRFTGHKVTRHVASAPTLLTDAGYFVVIDGLGDSGKEPKLHAVTPIAGGFLLTGEIANVFDDDEPPVAYFELELAPGDAPGCWKRQRFTVRSTPFAGR